MAKKKICFTAESFGFGPISTTLNLLKVLKQETDLSKKYTFTLFGNHTSKQLAKTCDYIDEIIECDTSTTMGFQKCEEYMKDIQLFICNTNPAPIPLLKQKGIPIVYIDLLFWMWDYLDDHLRHVDRYIIENFVEIEEQKKRIPIDNLPLKIVNPLIEEEKSSFEEDSSFLFISFGGIDNIFSKTPPLLDKLLDRALPLMTKEFKKVIVAGGGKTIGNLKKKYSNYPVEFGFYGRSAFQEYLNRAAKCIVNAGLITFYECCIRKKDLFLLPSFNYSQYQQFKIIQKKFPSLPGWDYSCSSLFAPVPMYLPEVEGLRRVSQNVEMFISDEDALEAWTHQVKSFLLEPKRNWLGYGNSIIQSGILEVVEEIKKFV